ncbi:MAG: glycoside hydrolase family 2 TIM barrel-domain containing protein [Bacteroidales bacterium]
MPGHRRMLFIPVLFLNLFSAVNAQRTTLSLNGTWEIGESMEAGNIPAKFEHTIQVPGLANMAVPAFTDAGSYFSADYLNNYFVKTYVEGIPSLPPGESRGVNRQPRNYYWYRTSFEIHEKKELCLLRINKAQFGTSVWLNGKLIGEHLGCFSSATFDITGALKKAGKNILLIRIGAHPGVLPKEIPAGSDYEKVRWQAGIYDDVSVISCNNPFIGNIQVAPDIVRSRIVVQSRIINKGSARPTSFDYLIIESRSGLPVGHAKSSNTIIGSGEEIIITDTISIPNAKFWSPENPFLYTLKMKTAGDDMDIRFGMREFHFETATKRAWLNGKIIFLRGTNITLHRFFDDPLCGNNPWDEAWVRKLLGEIPQKFNWNAMRFCIGPVPDKWLDIADEYGLIIQDEFFIWPQHPEWSKGAIKDEVKQWMTDAWNHPSVGWWDICNENNSEMLREIIRELRPLDLSGRAWDNGYGLPVGADDPIEDHHYLNFSNPALDFSVYEKGVAAKTTNSPHPSAHACVLNEYGWLWLNRKGEPTILTKEVYTRIAPDAANEKRIETYAYLLALETEYFRAHRNYAGVLHFTLLTGDFYKSITGDLFADPVKQIIHPAYEIYLTEAFRPLGVFVNLSNDSIAAGRSLLLPVMLVNDKPQACSGKIIIELTAGGKTEILPPLPFSIGALGATTVEYTVVFPNVKGNCHLEAIVSGSIDNTPTHCRRKFYLY